MALATVAMAIAWLLIKDSFDASRNAVSILSNRFGEEGRAHGFRQRSRRHGSVKCRNRFRGRFLRGGACGSRRSSLRNQHQTERHCGQNDSAKNLLYYLNNIPLSAKSE